MASSSLELSYPPLRATGRPLFGAFATRQKLKHFFADCPKEICILELGSGGSVVGSFLKNNGWKNYLSLDLVPPADLVGNILDWASLGLERESFDVVLAFEVLEHGDFLSPCFELLKPGGQLFATSPNPLFDWVCQFLETIGLNQRRTTAHTHLHWRKNLGGFQSVSVRYFCGISQWTKLVKPKAAAFERQHP